MIGLSSAKRAEKLAAYASLSIEEKKSAYDQNVLPRIESGQPNVRGMRWITFEEYDGLTVQVDLVGEELEKYEAQEDERRRVEYEKTQKKLSEEKKIADETDYDDEAKKLLASGLSEWRKGGNRRIYLTGSKGYYDIINHKYS